MTNPNLDRSQETDLPQTAASPQGGCCGISAGWLWGLGLLILVIVLLAMSLWWGSGERNPDPEPAQPGAAATQVRWQESFPAALTEAARQQRPVLLQFSASWCGPCRVMEADAWPDQRVQAALADNVVPVKIDVDRDTDVARRYGIHSIPALLLVDSHGEELARGGFMSAEALVQFLAENRGS